MEGGRRLHLPVKLQRFAGGALPSHGWTEADGGCVWMPPPHLPVKTQPLAGVTEARNGVACIGGMH